MKKCLLIFLLVCFSSCTKENEDTAQPQTLLARIEKSCSNTDNETIREIIQEYVNETSSTKEYQYVLKAKYEGKTIFVLGNCCPNCNSVIMAYDCSGDYLGYVDSTNGGRENAIDDNKITDKEKLWPKTPNCGF